MLQQSYNRKSTKQPMKTKKSNVMYVPASAGNTVTYINKGSSESAQTSTESHQNDDNVTNSQDLTQTGLLTSNDNLNTPTMSSQPIQIHILYYECYIL
eukprot:UN08154